MLECYWNGQLGSSDTLYWSHLVVEVGEEHEEGDHVGNARVLWDGDWGNSNYEEDYRTILFFGNNLQENGDDMDESDSWSNLHPHWEVAPNPYGIEAHHKGSDELDHLTVYVAWTLLWMCGLVQMWYRCDMWWYRCWPSEQRWLAIKCLRREASWNISTFLVKD